MITSLDELPNVAAYLRRVGATAKSFRVATVSREVRGYPKDMGTIRIDAQGGVSVTGIAAAPTPEELALIKPEVQAAEFPTYSPPAAIAAPPEGVDLSDPNVFVCHDFDGNVALIHERYVTKTGEKGFIPWTNWSDGVWRKMEPETLPFYGLNGYKDRSTLFVHEGPKGARAVKRMLDGEEDASRFPWLEYMRLGHHIGWIGGVHNIHKSDWEKLAAHSWKRVVIIADNDAQGLEIVPKLSELFQCRVDVLVFTERWPGGFDLGDKFPKDMYSPKGQYIGPDIVQLLQPATWATDEFEIPAEGRGRPRTIHIIRPAFADQWIWVESQDVVVNKYMPHWFHKAANFDKLVRPFSHCNNTSAVLQRTFRGAAVGLSYDPSTASRMALDSRGLPAVNLYRPSVVRPIPSDATPFLDFLRYLIPNDEERAEAERWIATLIARTGVRMKYGILLLSRMQGTGKSTLASILTELVGKHNSSMPSADMIVDNQFTGWLANKRLVVVHEIYQGHSWKAYNKIKSFVTDDDFEVNIKHLATYNQTNWTAFCLNSNSMAALKIEDDDRRFFVPRITENRWPVARFVALWDWVRSGGLAAIAHWAHTFEERGGVYVGPGDIAPMSEAKRALIEESRSELHTMLLEFAETLRDMERPVVLSLRHLRAYMDERCKDKTFMSAQEFAELWKQNGMLPCRIPVKFTGLKHTLITNDRETSAVADPMRLREKITSPADTFERDY